MLRIKLLTETEGDAQTQEIFDEIREMYTGYNKIIVALDLQPED